MVFIEESAFHCKKGDFHRIPANKIHWAWNRSDTDTMVVEAHAPALVGGAATEGSLALFDEGEKPQIKGPGVNNFLPYDSASVERKYFSS